MHKLVQNKSKTLKKIEGKKLSKTFPNTLQRTTTKEASLLGVAEIRRKSK